MKSKIVNTETKWAVVTGGSKGIGFELAREFARNGYDVLITARGEDVDAAAKKLSAETGARIETFRADLTKRAGVESVAARIASDERALDAIALNAGVCVGGAFVAMPARAGKKPIATSALEDELDEISLNITSVVHLAKLVLPAMVERGAGRVLITSSISAWMPGPYETVYAASKAFLLSFSEAIREELRSTGVTVTALLPGPSETGIFRRAGLARSLVGRMPKDSPEKVAQVGVRALLKGDATVIGASARTRLFAIGERILPHRALAKLHRVMSHPDPELPV